MIGTINPVACDTELRKQVQNKWKSTLSANVLTVCDKVKKSKASVNKVSDNYILAHSNNVLLNKYK